MRMLSVLVGRKTDKGSWRSPHLASEVRISMLSLRLKGQSFSERSEENPRERKEGRREKRNERAFIRDGRPDRAGRAGRGRIDGGCPWPREEEVFLEGDTERCKSLASSPEGTPQIGKTERDGDHGRRTKKTKKKRMGPNKKGRAQCDG